MKKRISFILFTLAFLLCLSPVLTWADGEEGELPAASLSGTCGENLTWSFDEATGTLTIEGSGEMTNYVDDYEEGEHVPWQACRESLTSLSLPEGLTTIGDWAFAGCESMKAVRCLVADPDEVEIGGNAFYGVEASCVLYVPAQAVEKYKALSPWNGFTIRALPE